MEGPTFAGQLARRADRIPMNGPVPGFVGTPVIETGTTNVLVERARESVDCEANPNLCEKPVNTSALAIPIAVGISVPVLIGIFVVIYLHRRNAKRQKREEANDPHRGLDFGLDGGKKGRKSMLMREKSLTGRRQRQMSMDLNMSTPYLLPPQVQGSRESLHSLARTLHNNEDPYKPVGHYAGSDTASLSSRKLREGSSIRTGSSIKTGGSSLAMQSPRDFVPPPRQNSLPTKKPVPPQTAHVQNPYAQDVRDSDSLPQFPTPQGQDPYEHQQPYPDQSPYPQDGYGSSPMPPMPEVQEPPPAAVKSPRGGLPTSPVDRPKWDTPPVPRASRIEAAHPTADAQSKLSPDQTPAKLDRVPEDEQAQTRFFESPESAKAVPATAEHAGSPAEQYRQPLPPVHVDPASASAPVSQQTSPNDQYYLNDYQYQNPGYASQDYSQAGYDQGHHGQQYDEYNQYEQQERRYSAELPRDDQALGVPQQHSSKRVSVGFRPLPPDDIADSEDPEYRANRIRSFYKEYFDPDTKRESAVPPPLPVPPQQYQNEYQYQQHRPQPSQQSLQYQQHQAQPSQQYRQPPQGYAQGPQQQQQQYASQDYYEDYDQQYLGDAAYFDPDSNAFVMPYAQPVTRRAMTPPPARMRGPPPPRGMHGSMSNMSLPGQGPRPGSSASNRFGHSRPGSSMSGFRGRDRKPRPPPQALTTLPNPSKLKDDSFAILNAADFAPPDGFKEQARGRSQSPAPERKPYKLNVPIASPLSSSYDDLASVPSPHLLRKSGTFTGLDFAPPRRFGEGGDNMSDAGSVRSGRSNRSNRSAVSNVNLRAIREQSHLPNDTIMTQKEMKDTLKPSWTMRP